MQRPYGTLQEAAAYRGGWRRLALASALAAAACAEATAPPEPEPAISVTVTSPVGAVLGVGSAVDFDLAVTIDEAPVTVSPTWTSSDPAVASVSAGGRVEGVAPGSATISATYDGVTGATDLQVVDVDLDGVTALLEDEFVEAAVAALSAATRSALQATVNDCLGARNDQNVIGLDVCLRTAESQLSAPANEDETVLLAVLGLILRFAQGLVDY